LGVKKGKPEDPKKLRNLPSVAILDQEPDRAAANVRFFYFATPLFRYPVDTRKYSQNTYVTYIISSHRVSHAARLFTIAVKLIVNETRALCIMKERGERSEVRELRSSGEWLLVSGEQNEKRRWPAAMVFGPKVPVSFPDLRNARITRIASGCSEPAGGLSGWFGRGLAGCSFAGKA
jgi:hypothetical protein